jgi:hypothetical protein
MATSLRTRLNIPDVGRAARAVCLAGDKSQVKIPNLSIGEHLQLELLLLLTNDRSIKRYYVVVVELAGSCHSGVEFFVRL